MLEQVPNSLIAGDTWSWTRDLAEYPAPTWVLTYHFSSVAGSFDAVGTADGTEHVFTVPAATSAAYKADRYRWVARATSGVLAYTVDQGWVDVVANPASRTRGDSRSHARKVLDAIEATLEGRASSDQMSISIAGRTISRISIPDLMLLRDRYRAEVRSVEQPAGTGRGRNIRVRLLRG